MKGYFCSRTFTHRVDELNAKLAYSMYAQIFLRVAFREVMILQRKGTLQIFDAIPQFDESQKSAHQEAASVIESFCLEIF